MVSMIGSNLFINAALLAGILYGLIAYALYSMGMYRIATRIGYHKPWLAWVPIINAFMIPILTNGAVLGILRHRFLDVSVVAVCIPIILYTFMDMPYALTIGKLIVRVLWLYGFYIITLNFSKRPGVHMIVAILTGTASIPVQVFMLRNQEDRIHYVEYEDEENEME